MQKSIYFLFCLFVLTATAQKSAIYATDIQEYNTVISLFKNKQFQSAQIIFNKIIADKRPEFASLEEDSNYYNANCAIQLNQENANGLMEDFIENYPTSPKQNQAAFELANYHFHQSNFQKALEWFNKVDDRNISKDDIDKFNFQNGYCYFVSKDKKQADLFFNKVLNSTDYGSQAKYYLGFMAYENDDYKTATKQFDQVSGDDKFKAKLSYFQADMNFKQGNFQKAIDLGTVAMQKSTASEKSELNKIIGESYFNLKKYDNALPFLKEYKGQKGKWSNTDFYQLGYTYYKQNDFENAISQFNKIIEGRDFVAQNGYYHLGECYLKTDKKQQALNAFKNASEMEFDLKIKEDAALNYAKLSYEIGNAYQSIPDILVGFITKYPRNSSKLEIENLLVNSYITSKNYDAALEILEKINNPNNKEIYQKASYYRAVEKFTDGNYQEALALFKKSLANNISEKFIAKATFWKAETEFVLENFVDALIDFKAFINIGESKTVAEYANINYNIAYCLFKQKQYETAGNFFHSQIDNAKEDITRLNDSYLRLGDCRFVTSKYLQAIDAYNKVIESKGLDADYAAFQKAISFGFISKNDKKVEDFNQFLKNYPKSQYRDDVLFEFANTLVAENKTDLAIKAYDQLIAESKNGSYNARAILKQGLIFYNGNKDDLAIAKFKKVVANYPKSPESLEAVATARLIYVDNGNLDEYATWVRTLDFVEVSDAELDDDTYKFAEKQYLQNNAKGAIAGFAKYVSQFPDGINALKANFYLAQSRFADGQESASIGNYNFVVGKPKSEFTEQALARLTQIHLKTNDYSNALPILKRLETEADFPQNINFAQANLMKVNYENKDFATAVIYAEKVLMNPKTDNKVKADAQIIIARSAIKTNDDARARTAYAKLLTIAKGELAAEALYYDAYFKNKDGKFELSNKAVNKLSKDYSSYKYFGAKGLIVMAKNFYGLKDSFQATYILNTVIENFADFDDVVLEAQTVLDGIKNEESKTNSSIKKTDR
jgi:tetratricopeptide (TPR) repeat protein